MFWVSIWKEKRSSVCHWLTLQLVSWHIDSSLDTTRIKNKELSFISFARSYTLLREIFHLKNVVLKHELDCVHSCRCSKLTSVLKKHHRLESYSSSLTPHRFLEDLRNESWEILFSVADLRGEKRSKVYIAVREGMQSQNSFFNWKWNKKSSCGMVWCTARSLMLIFSQTIQRLQRITEGKIDSLLVPELCTLDKMLGKESFQE